MNSLSSHPNQVRFSISDATTLADLLALQLHRVEDDVRAIVDKAVKEMGTEKVPSWCAGWGVGPPCLPSREGSHVTIPAVGQPCEPSWEECVILRPVEQLSRDVWPLAVKVFSPPVLSLCII